MPLKPAMYSITHLKNEIFIVNQKMNTLRNKKQNQWNLLVGQFPENGRNQNILSTIPGEQPWSNQLQTKVLLLSHLRCIELTVDREKNEVSHGEHSFHFILIHSLVPSFLHSFIRLFLHPFMYQVYSKFWINVFRGSRRLPEYCSPGTQHLQLRRASEV